MTLVTINKNEEEPVTDIIRLKKSTDSKNCFCQSESDSDELKNKKTRDEELDNLL